MNSPETVAADALMAWLRMKLPATVDAINLTRAATLKTPTAERFVVPASAALLLSTSSPEAAGTVVPLTSGSRTASQVADDITAAAVPGLVATADTDGRLVLTSSTTPSEGVNSFVGFLADTTGGNAALGFDEGGEHVLRAALKAPSHRGVRDGYPTTVPDGGQGLWVMLGDRDSRPWPSAGADIRRGECDVHFVVELFNPATNTTAGHDREALTSCVRAMREVLQTDTGRYLGHPALSDSSIVRVDIGVTRIAGRSLSFTNGNTPNVLFDVAAMEITVRVFQRTQGA